MSLLNQHDYYRGGFTVAVKGGVRPPLSGRTCRFDHLNIVVVYSRRVVALQTAENNGQ